MSHLHPDDPRVVERIFDIDGKSLQRAGFTLPAEYRVFADDAQPKRTSITGALGYVGMPELRADTDQQVLNTDMVDERAYE